MKILGTGLSGLLGTRIVEMLSPKHEFSNLSLETGVDITDFQSLSKIFKASDADWVFHLAAFTDVDQAEKDRSNGANGIVWNVNVNATKNIAHLCQQTGKRMLYISTDFVFDGRQSEYSEEAVPNPLGWYGITKFEGENQIKLLDKYGLIVRIANPYRSKWPGKPDFVHKILSLLYEGKRMESPIDQKFTPTYIDDIVNALDYLSENNKDGIYHVVGSECLSPFAASIVIAAEFGCDVSNIHQTTFEKYMQNRAPRPFQACLNNGKITHCGINMKTFSEGLRSIRRQEGGKNL
jgi:dTDP-4-dehydrorhamnose reductase